MTTTMEVTAAEAMVEAVVVYVAGTTMAVGPLPDPSGEGTTTDQEASGIRGSCLCLNISPRHF